MSEFIDDPDLCNRVNELLQAFADAVDRGDGAAVAALFTADARCEHDAGTLDAGRAAIAARVQAGLQRLQGSHHQIGPARLERLRDGSLHATAYCIATHELRGGGIATVCGRYIDRIEEGSELLIAERRILVHLTAGTEREFPMLERVPLSEIRRDIDRDRS